jgi:RNA polymerase sigma-70 factor (ECF subfamily)
MSGSIPTPDLLLARRAAAGHGEAWDQIIDEHGKRLFNVALQFASSREEAEDLTQDIFLRLYRNLRSYRGDVPLIAWALRLSRNLCIDHYRRMRRERSWTRVSETVLNQLPAKDNVEAESQRRQRIEAIYAALADLPEELSELVLLRDLQGWSSAETAAYLGIPLGTLKSRLHRARLQLTERVRARLNLGSTDSSASEAVPC